MGAISRTAVGAPKAHTKKLRQPSHEPRLASAWFADKKQRLKPHMWLSNQVA